MDIRNTVRELASEFEALKKQEMELKMAAGKYDEKVTALMKELGINGKDPGAVNIVEILNSALNKSLLILPQ